MEMQDKTQTPYHTEAAQYGANIREIKQSRINSNYEATEIRRVWDYRKAGLKVDQARELLSGWLRPSYHHKSDYSWAGHYQGRILSLGVAKQRVVEMHRKFNPSDIRTLYAGEKLRWNDSQAKIRVGGRIIVIDRYEDVTWPSYGYGRQARWPESTSVYYVSRLIRDTAPTLRDALEGCGGGPLSAATERSIRHDCRGNWVARVVKELLGIEGYKLSPEPPHAPSTVYKIVEKNGCLRSVFEPGITYPIKSWVGEKITGSEHGEGGIYCYNSQNEAIEAARQGEVFCEAWASGKTLVIAECWTKDHVQGQRGKLCVETLQIRRVLHEVTHATS